MFTGIITGVGRIAAVDDLGSSDLHGKRLTIETPAGYLEDVGLGDSIALNGACMTVTSLDAGAGRVELPVSKTVVAAQLGMKKETLSRLLRQLALDGVIEVARREISILDRAGLKRVALQ